MRIGLFTDSYAPQVSGVVTVVRVLKAELERLGHKVYIFTVSHKEAAPDSNIIRVKSFQFPNEPQHRVGVFSNHEIIKKAKECNLDIIHTHSEFSLYFAAKAVSQKLKIPMVHTLHTYYPDYLYYVPLFEPFLRNREYKLLRRILKYHKCIIAPSRKIYHYLEKHNFSQPIKIIPNGIELKAFSAGQENSSPKALQAFREAYRINPEEELVVFVGRLAIEKNIVTLLNNFKKMHDVMPKLKLLIAGDGPDRRDLLSYTKSLGLENAVLYLGYLNWPDEISTCYAVSKLFMSASHSEVHPITFIEAMAAGLPVVCAQDISIQDMVLNGENGFAVEDDTKLWEKALEILADPAKQESMGKRSAELSANYSVKTFVERMTKLYEEYALHK